MLYDTIRGRITCHLCTHINDIFLESPVPSAYQLSSWNAPFSTTSLPSKNQTCFRTWSPLSPRISSHLWKSLRRGHPNFYFCLFPQPWQFPEVPPIASTSKLSSNSSSKTLSELTCLFIGKHVNCQKLFLFDFWQWSPHLFYLLAIFIELGFSEEPFTKFRELNLD